MGKQAAALQVNRTLLIPQKPAGISGETLPSVALKPSGGDAVALVVTKKTGDTVTDRQGDAAVTDPAVD